MPNYNSSPSSPEDQPARIIRWDKGYLISVPGILKLVQLVCNLLGFLCIKVSTAWVSPIFYNLLYWIGMIMAIFLLLVYITHFVEKFGSWPWLKCEFVYYSAMCLTYIGCSIFATALQENVGYAVGFFGFCAVIAYGFDAFLKFKAHRNGSPVQCS